jgi:hypothetical protein
VGRIERLAADSAPRTSARQVPARLIVCERTGRWAATLRRELASSGVRVWETRTLDGCFEELTASPASFAVLELSGDLSELLRHLARQRREFPAARSAVVAERRQAGYEWLLREAGVVHFLCSPRRAGLLGQMAYRHLVQTPPVQQSITDRIWSSLPWSRD